MEVGVLVPRWVNHTTFMWVIRMICDAVLDNEREV